MKKHVLVLTSLAVMLWLAAGLSAWAQGTNENNVSVTSGPTVKDIGATSAVVVWDTNTPSSSIVNYGTNSQTYGMRAEKPWGATHHEVRLNNLQPGTTYYILVSAANGRGMGTTSFTTMAEQPSQGNTNENNVSITSGPTVKEVRPTSAVVVWDTNTASSSVVNYGINSQSYGLRAEKPWGATHHEVPIQNLQPNTTYYVLISAANGRGMGTTQFTTPPQ